MSECVVRMKMPKCCDDCCANYDCCACGIIGAFWFRNPGYKEFDSSKERLPNCPIICQLPEGHGRLVDADELRREMYHEAFETDTNMQKWDSGCWIRYKMFENTIGAVPTIVPAEAERSET